MTFFSHSRRPDAAHATAVLLPSDGGKKAEHRTHPVSLEPLGTRISDRLSALPDELARSVADACDANLGMSGEGRRRH